MKYGVGMGFSVIIFISDFMKSGLRLDVKEIFNLLGCYAA